MGATASKFKVGDLVRAVKNDYAGGYKRGDEFTLKGVNSRGMLEIVDTDGDNRTRPTEDFEIVAPQYAFKVGDRVRVLADGFGRAEAGQKGTVAEIDQLFVGVEMDAPFDGHGKSGHRWNFFHPDEEIVAVAPQPQQPAEPQLTIQAGKFYMTRDGRKVGPMYRKYAGDRPWGCDQKGYSGVEYRDDGVRTLNIPAGDLIAEWVDEPAADAPVAAPVAEQPAAKPKFKVGDRVRLVREGLSTTGAIGLTAVIESIDDGASWPILLRFDKRDVRQFKTVAHPSHYTRAVEDDIEPTGVSAPFAFIGGKAVFRADQFVVHSGANPSTPAIVCLMENGRPQPAASPHVHPSTGAAEREAARLADLHKGKEFAVFELGSSCRKEPEYAHEWQRLAVSGRDGMASESLARKAGLSRDLAHDAVMAWLKAA